MSNFRIHDGPPKNKDALDHLLRSGILIFCCSVMDKGFCVFLRFSLSFLATHNSF
jgi:hypothetical protein